MKKTKILFYDDEPQGNKKLAKALAAAGYEVASLENSDLAQFEITTGHVELLVHCGLRSKTHGKIVEKLIFDNPLLPSLHIAVGQEAEDFQDKFKGPLHQKLRPLAPQDVFIKKVKRLLYMGKMAKKNELYQNLVQAQLKMEGLLDAQNLFEFKQKATLIFLEQYQARNVFYFESGEVQHFVGGDFKESEIYNVDRILAEEHRVIAAQFTDAFQIQSFLKQALPQMPAGWEKRRLSQRYIDVTADPKFIVVPLLGKSKTDVLGHFFIIEPSKGLGYWAEEAMDILHKSLGRYVQRVEMLVETKDKSYIDDLTDLYNQRYLALVLDKEINRAQRTQSCFSVLFMDIDHFKRVNDTRGHVVGSKLLKELAKILSNNIRTVDYGFRYGGDEFIMILVGSDAEQAKVVAERTRKQVEECVFDIDGVKLQVTLSIGIASCPEHATTREQILEMADQAMYVGKSKSRNVVFVAS